MRGAMHRTDKMLAEQNCVTSNDCDAADNLYQPAGAHAGITNLVNAFHDQMLRQPAATKALSVKYLDNIELSQQKLVCFLSVWLDGPPRNLMGWSRFSTSNVHEYLPVEKVDIDAWVLCMSNAVTEQPYVDSFKEYFLTQLFMLAQTVNEKNQN